MEAYDASESESARDSTFASDLTYTTRGFSELRMALECATCGNEGVDVVHRSLATRLHLDHADRELCMRARFEGVAVALAVVHQPAVLVERERDSELSLLLVDGIEHELVPLAGRIAHDAQVLAVGEGAVRPDRSSDDDLVARDDDLGVEPSILLRVVLLGVLDLQRVHVAHVSILGFPVVV